MSLSDSIYTLVRRYIRRTPPVNNENLSRYFSDELQSLERALQTLVEASIVCVDHVDASEQTARDGMVRYFVNVTYRGQSNLNGLHVYSRTNGWQPVQLASAYPP
jgi:hypothetical protein